MSEPKIEDLPVSDLEIDRLVQRSRLQEPKIENMVKHWNDAAVGVATVSRRADGSQIVLDGMHRARAIQIRTSNTGTVRCHVYEGLTFAQEAQIFLDLNAGNQPTVLDKFRVRISAGDPIAVEIAKVLMAYRWTIEPGRRKGTVQCVGKLEAIHRLGLQREDPTLLSDVIKTVTNAWGDDPYAVQAAVVDGIAAVLVEYGSSVDLPKLATKLSEYSGGAQQLITDAEGLANVRRGMRTSMALASQVVDAYNKGSRTRVLYPWRRTR